MTIQRDIDGTLKLYQGDTGGFSYDGIPTDKNYFVFCEIRDRNGTPVGKQLMVESEGNPSVTFYIDDDLSDRLIVPFGRKFEPYSYGIKLCDPETYSEDTVNLLGLYGKACRIIVYPKQAEGLGVVGGRCPVPPPPPHPVPDIKPVPYGPHKPQGYDLKRMVTREELARKLATKVDDTEFETLSADVVMLAQQLATHIETEPERIEEKVNEVVGDKIDVIVEEKIGEIVEEIVEEKVDEAIDERIDDLATKEDLADLDNRYLSFEDVEM